MTTRRCPVRGAEVGVTALCLALDGRRAQAPDHECITCVLEPSEVEERLAEIDELAHREEDGEAAVYPAA